VALETSNKVPISCVLLMYQEMYMQHLRKSVQFFLNNMQTENVPVCESLKIVLHL